MKRIAYKKRVQMHEYDAIDGKTVSKDVLIDFELPLSNENEAIAKVEAHNGEYIIEDDGIEEIAEPTQLDIIEAQVIYTAMMTDTLLEV